MPRPIFYLDIETDNTEGFGLDPFLTKVVTIQILLPDEQVYLKKNPTAEDIERIKLILAEGLIVGANIKFDAKVLEAQYDVQLKHLYDVQIAELVISGGLKVHIKGATTYKTLVKQYCGLDISKEEQETFAYDKELTSEQIDYACADVLYLPIIYKKQQERIKELNLDETIKIEMESIPALVWLELSGIYLSTEKANEFEQAFKRQKEEAAKSLHEALGNINFNSPAQLKVALQQKGILLESTKKDELKKYQNEPAIKALMDYKALEKLSNTFTSKIPSYIHPKTGRIHANFRQFGARSGRMSCTNPNLQQQPTKDIEIKNAEGILIKTLAWRDVYQAREGYKVVTADYNQMELRILTQASLDPILIQVYREDLDLHTMTAELVNNEKIDPKTEEGKKKRKAAKKINFGIPYGVSKYGLSSQILAEGIPCTVKEASNMLLMHKKAYPQMHEYLNSASREAVQHLSIRNLSGRLICYENPIRAFKRERKRRYLIKQGKKTGTIRGSLKGYYKSLHKSIRNNGKNNPIQSLGADILKIALKDLYDKLKTEPVRQDKRQIFFINVVHDEVVFEVPEERVSEVSEIIRESLENAGKKFITVIDCPVSLAIADCWEK